MAEKLPNGDNLLSLSPSCLICNIKFNLQHLPNKSFVCYSSWRKMECWKNKHKAICGNRIISFSWSINTSKAKGYAKHQHCTDFFVELVVWRFQFVEYLRYIIPLNSRLCLVFSSTRKSKHIFKATRRTVVVFTFFQWVFSEFPRISHLTPFHAVLFGCFGWIQMFHWVDAVIFVWSLIKSEISFAHLLSGHAGAYQQWSDKCKTLTVCLYRIVF